MKLPTRNLKLRGNNCACGIESISGRRKILLRGIFRTKNLDDILAAAQEEGHKLKRTLGPINITLLGIGAIIGAGIFATVGTAQPIPIPMRRWENWSLGSSAGT